MPDISVTKCTIVGKLIKRRIRTSVNFVSKYMYVDLIWNACYFSRILIKIVTRNEYKFSWKSVGRWPSFPIRTRWTERQTDGPTTDAIIRFRKYFASIPKNCILFFLIVRQSQKNEIKWSILTFWRRIFFSNFSTPCI